MFTERATQFRVFPSESPITFQPTEQNKGKPCRAVYYGGGLGDGVYNPYCYDLQVKLSSAAEAGDMEQIKELIRSGANANAEAGDSVYPLEAAALHRHTNAARLLLDNGADVNHWHPIRSNPLLNAVFSGDAETVELLLSRGANVNLESDNYTALKAAREGKNQEIISLLERAGAKK